MSLTQDQIAIIKKTWETVGATPEDSGEAILLAFFEKYPHNKKYFESFKDLELSQLKGNNKFRKHSLKLIGTFDKSIKCLDQEGGMDEIKTIISRVGATHAKRHIKKESYLELQETLLTVLTNAGTLNEDGQLAWKTLIDIIYEIIFEKMED